MNGIKALQALKDGRIVEFRIRNGETYQYRYRRGFLEVRGSDRKTWKYANLDANTFLRENEFELVEEYDLTFVEAFQAMLDGKKVVCEDHESIHQYIKDGRIYNCDPDDGREYQSFIYEYEQGSKWRVVE